MPSTVSGSATDGGVVVTGYTLDVSDNIVGGRDAENGIVDARSGRRDAVMQKPTKIVVRILMDCTILITLGNHLFLAVVLEFDPVHDTVGADLQHAGQGHLTKPHCSSLSIFIKNSDTLGDKKGNRYTKGEHTS